MNQRVSVTDIEYADKILDLIEARIEQPESEFFCSSIEPPEEMSVNIVELDLARELGVEISELDAGGLIPRAAKWFAEKWNKMARDMERRIDNESFSTEPERIEFGDRNTRIALAELVRKIRQEDADSRGAA